jgi:very-short-patch-repair endonuclease
MKAYYKKHQHLARALRNNPTEVERKLWQRLKGKQLNNYQFYRQRMLGKYIVDFYCPELKLIIELDGGQHYEENHQQKDEKRDAYFKTHGIRVERFTNLEVLQQMEVVMNYLYELTSSRESTSYPPFQRGRSVVIAK